MKSISKFTFLSFMALALLWACKKEENKITYQGGTAPVFNASTNVLNLHQADSDKVAIEFSWSNPNYSFTTGVSSRDVNYIMEIDTVGAKFTNPLKITVSLGTALNTFFSVKGFNDLMVNGLKLDTAHTHNIEMRILTNIDNVNATKLISNVVACTVKPYAAIAAVYYLHVPGDYQSSQWSPDKAPILGSYSKDAYEGYVYLPNAANEFKFTSQADWGGTNYGVGATKDKLNTDGGAKNLHIDGAGYYRLKADITNLAWTYDKTTWAIIGQATPAGWGTDTPMTFDPATSTWSIEIDLTQDEFKFRANGSYDINFGDDPASDYLKYGGDNLKVTTGGGHYKVVLDLTNAPKYTYTLTKL